MPELPEVEVCRRGLLPGVLGRRIDAVEVRCPRLRHEIPAELPQILAGQHILNIRRRGKYLLFDCRREGAPDDADARGTLIVHLGMTGNLRLFHPGTPVGKHDHLDFALGELIMRYSDPRRFGTVLWQPGETPETHPLLAVMGIEPLSEAFTADWLYAELQQRGGPVKPVLMDSHLIVGIGNIYAAESLFRAGISPLRPADRIGRERVGRLAEAIKATLSDAIQAGGSSIRDYVHSDGGSGYFQIDCGVYNRAGEPCRRCGGTVRQVRQAGRSTFYCPSCQR